MTRQQMGRALALAAAGGGLVVPALAMVARSFFGPVSPGSVLIGSLAATAFLGVSGLVTLIAWEGKDLRSLIIRSYVVKVSMLAALGVVLTDSSIDVGAFCTAIVASAAAFLAVQTTLVARNR